MHLLSWRGIARVVVPALLAAGASLPARAQTLPSEPLVFGGGWLTVGGDVSFSFSCPDRVAEDEGTCGKDAGFFNYTDYKNSALRMLRVDVAMAAKASDRVSVLGEVRTENGELPHPYALYLRVTPWISRAFDVQIGLIPPTFGAFARRTYPADNLLIGYPLAYQYLTSLRADALPANADELLRMRARGWLSSFSIGSATEDNGLPLVNAFGWDTGVQMHAANDFVDAAVAVTTGTVGNPRIGDDNRGKQVVGRVAVRPTAGLIAGFSAAKGPFVARETSRAAGMEDDNGRFTQTAWGGDIEYSRGYYLVRFETIVSDWRVPVVRAPAISLPLRAMSASIEGRYKLRPGLYAAARFDHLGFSEITGSTRRDKWDAPVTRIEIGGGYSIQRNLVLKLSYQRNTREGGRARTVNVGAAQAVYWF